MHGMRSVHPRLPGGALQIIDGKARLISDFFCDGLGACSGTCAKGAISVIEREAGAYNEKAVMETIVRQGEGLRPISNILRAMSRRNFILRQSIF